MHTPITAVGRVSRGGAFPAGLGLRTAAQRGDGHPGGWST